MKRNPSLKSHAIGQKKSPAPVDARTGHRNANQSGKIITTRTGKSTAGELRDFLSASVTLAAASCAQTRARLRAAQRANRAALQRLDALTRELARANRREGCR